MPSCSNSRRRRSGVAVGFQRIRSDEDEYSESSSDDSVGRNGPVTTHPIATVNVSVAYYRLFRQNEGFRSRNSPLGPLRIGQSIERAELANQVNKYLLEVAEAENYRLSQENGQRIFGPPIGMEDRMLDYTYEVFISNIPPKFYEDKLLPLFLSLGKLYTFRFMMNFNGDNRGYAFAKFVDRRSVEHACRLNGYPITPERKLKVVRCRNNNLLFVGYFRLSHVDAYDMIGKFTDLLFGLKNVTLCEPNRYGKFSYVLEFFSHTDTAQARRILLSDDEFFFNYPKIVVEWFGRVGTYTNPSMIFEWSAYGASRSVPPKVTLFRDGLPAQILRD